MHNPKSVSCKDYASLIAAYPLFCLLSPKDIDQLASIGKEISINPGTIITREGDITDSVYLIISGTAEVKKTLLTVEQTVEMHIATLRENDAIGLGEEGFFSQSGIRTARVVALSPMVLLEFDLMSFNQFLNLPGIPYPALKSVGEKILLMNFIQKTKLFLEIKKESIEQLARKTKKVFFKAGEFLFKEGDNADTCYFILSGQIIIITQDQQIIATLGPSDIVGEGAFLDKGKRNASAQIKIDAELFELDHHDIEPLINPWRISFLQKNLNILRVKQIRPNKQPGISIIKNKSPEGDEIFILNNESRNKQLQIAHLDYAIWDCLDGKTTVDEIFNKMTLYFDKLSLDDFYIHLLNMEKKGFIQLPKKELVIQSKSSIWNKIANKIFFWLNRND